MLTLHRGRGGHFLITYEIDLVYKLRKEVNKHG